jgi:hypothetical protein
MCDESSSLPVVFYTEIGKYVRCTPRSSLVLTFGGGSDVAPFDVRIEDVSARVLILDVGWTSLSTATRPIITRIKPGHLLCGIVPDANC